MELGADGACIRSFVINIPNYWPDEDLVRINNNIWSLPVIERNILVMQRVLGYSYQEIGRACEYSKSWAFKETNKIELKLVKLLNE